MTLRKTLESQSFLIIANVLTGILSIVILGVVGHNLSYVRSSGARNGSFNIVYNVTRNDGHTAQESQVIARLPQDLRLGSYWLMLAAGIGGFIDTVLLAIMLSWRKASIWKAQSESDEAEDVNLYPQTPLSIFIAAFSLCRSLAATIYAFYEWAASGAFNPSDALPLTNGRYSDPSTFFTPDAWNCQVEDYIPIEAQNNPLEMLCNEGTASRTVTLALTVLAAVVLGCILWRTYLRRRRARSGEFGRNYGT